MKKETLYSLHEIAAMIKSSCTALKVKEDKGENPQYTQVRIFPNPFPSSFVLTAGCDGKCAIYAKSFKSWVVVPK